MLARIELSLNILAHFVQADGARAELLTLALLLQRPPVVLDQLAKLSARLAALWFRLTVDLTYIYFFEAHQETVQTILRLVHLNSFRP